MVQSRVPANFGMPFLIDNFKLVDAEIDTHVVPTEKFVSKNNPCRIFQMPEQDEARVFGGINGKRIGVLVEGNPPIKRQELIKLSEDSQSSVIDAGDKYRVLSVKKNADEFGAVHHLSLIAELEDQDVTC